MKNNDSITKKINPLAPSSADDSTIDRNKLNLQAPAFQKIQQRGGGGGGRGKGDEEEHYPLLQPLSTVIPLPVVGTTPMLNTNTNTDKSEVVEEEEEEEEKTCRICFEEDDPEHTTMIAPCRCKGSSRWVHRECLDEWRTQEKEYVLINVT